MTMMHIWLKLQGRLLWGGVALAILGMISLLLEVARDTMVLWGWVGVGGDLGVAMRVASTGVLFFVAAFFGRRSYDQVASVVGSCRSGFDISLYLDRASLCFWSAVLISCVACLIVQILRLSTQVALWLGIWWPGRTLLTLGALPCVLLFAYLLLHRLAGRVAAGFDVVRRPAISGPSSHDR